MAHGLSRAARERVVIVAAGDASACRPCLPARVAWQRVTQRAGGRGVRRLALTGVLEACGAVVGGRLHVVGVRAGLAKAGEVEARAARAGERAGRDRVAAEELQAARGVAGARLGVVEAARG